MKFDFTKHYDYREYTEGGALYFHDVPSTQIAYILPVPDEDVFRGNYILVRSRFLGTSEGSTNHCNSGCPAPQFYDCFRKACLDARWWCVNELTA